MFSRVLSERAGVRVVYHKTDKGEFVVETVQDGVEQILERNKALALENGKDVGEWWAHVASIPNIVQLRWINEYGFNPVYAEDKTVLRRLLNDRDWRWLRTSELRV